MSANPKVIGSPYQDIVVLHDPSDLNAETIRTRDFRSEIKFHWKGKHSVTVALRTLKSSQRRPFFGLQYFLIATSYIHRTTGIRNDIPFILHEPPQIGRYLYNRFKEGPPKWLTNPFPSEGDPTYDAIGERIPFFFKGTTEGVPTPGLRWELENFSNNAGAIQVVIEPLEKPDESNETNSETEPSDKKEITKLANALQGLAKVIEPTVSIEEFLKVESRNVVVSEPIESGQITAIETPLRDLLSDLVGYLTIEGQKLVEQHEWTSRKGHEKISVLGEATDEDLRPVGQPGEIEKLLEKYSQTDIVLLSGGAGSGKSFAARSLCLTLLENHQRGDGEIPIYVSLRDWVIPACAKLDWDPILLHESLEQFICGQICSSLIDKYLPATLGAKFRALVREQKFLFILDGIDEIDLSNVTEYPPAEQSNPHSKLAYTRVCDAIQTFLELQRRRRGIIITRPSFRPAFTRRSKVKIIRILPVNSNKAHDFIIECTGRSPREIERRLQEQPALSRLTRNPLLIRMMTSFFNDRKKSRAQISLEDLFQHFTEEILEASLEVNQGRLIEPPEESSALTISKSNLDDALKALAYLLYVNDSFQVAHSIVQDSLTHHQLDALSHLRRFGFLRKSSRGIWSFSHNRFAEYYILITLRSKGERPGISRFGDSPHWQGLFSFYLNSAEEDKTQELAHFCWHEVIREDHSGKAASIQERELSLRWMELLIEGLATREYLVDSFSSEIASFVERKIHLPPPNKTYEIPLKHQRDLEWAQLAVRAIPLCPSTKQNKLLLLASKWEFNALHSEVLQARRSLTQKTPELDLELARNLSWNGLIQIFLGRNQSRQLQTFSPNQKSLKWFQSALIMEGGAAILSTILLLALSLLIWADSSIELKGKLFIMGVWIGPLAFLWWDYKLPKIFRRQEGQRSLTGKEHLFLIRLILSLAAILIVPLTNLAMLNKIVLITGLGCLFPIRIAPLSLLLLSHLKSSLIPIVKRKMVALIISFAKGSAALVLGYIYLTYQPNIKNTWWYWLTPTENVVWDLLIYLVLGYFTFFFAASKNRAHLSGLLHDWKHRGEIEVGRVMHRKEISELLDRQKTEGGRYLVVRQLRKHCQEALGEWPDGIPFYENDSSSQELRELDRRWTENDKST